jgi:hypothetical protein
MERCSGPVGVRTGGFEAINAINVIAPYKYLGMWVFDDPRVGLAREPFVSGADTMIDRAVADIPNAESGFIMLFAETPFPGHQFRLVWKRGDAGGNWYFSSELNLEGWLCPALLKYFEAAPKELYVQIKPQPLNPGVL